MQDVLHLIVQSLVMGAMFGAIPYFVLKRQTPFLHLVVAIATLRTGLLASGVASEGDLWSFLVPIVGAGAWGRFAMKINRPPRA